MIYTVPHYYSRFFCTASECPDTCCAGWQIMIDEKSLERYKHVPGPFKNRLHNSIDWKEACFKQYDGRCAFLNEDNLCDIYSEAGPGMLCRTCRNYPRHIEEFEGLREISLSLSCIEAAGLILGCREPVRFLSKEKEGKEEYPDFDFFLHTKLTDAREVIFRILQDRNVDIGVRMAMALSLSHDLQRRISRQELCLADSLFERYLGDGAARAFEERSAGYRLSGAARYPVMRKLFGILDHLEVLKADWPDYVKGLKEELYGAGSEVYAERLNRFFPDSRRDTEQWEVWMEQLMVYFVFTYFCGAVYDGKPYAKMKAAVVSTLLIREMAQAVWQQKGETFELGDLLEIAHRYSRELEHSDLNLNTVEDLLWKKETAPLELLIQAVQRTVS